MDLQPVVKREDQNSVTGVKNEGTPRLPDSIHYMCGFTASMVNIIVTFPINKLMFRQQLYCIGYRQAGRQLYNEGFFTLYRGLLPPLLQKSSSMSLMFGLYNYYHRLLMEHCSMSAHTATVAAGFMAGTCEATFTPLERVQTLLQDPKYTEQFRNTSGAFRQILTKHGGVPELYRGLTPVLYRNGPSSAIFFTLRRPIRERLKTEEDDSKLKKAVYDFLSGSAVGAFCSTLMFPVNVVKTRMQAQLGGPFHSFSHTFQVIWKERDRSWRKVYAGIQVNLVRSFISWGIINAVYEIMLAKAVAAIENDS